LKNKIGVFDSGIGGLTVLKEIYKHYPNEDYIYIGDNKNLPYGEKTKEQLLMYASKIFDYFIKEKVNIVVIACNTMCSNVFSKLTNKYKNVNIIGVIDATVDSFIKENKSNVLVIGTTATIKSNIYEKKIKSINSNINVYSLPTPKLVPLIENMEDVKDTIDEYLKPYDNIDSIILGCTHYKLIDKYINKNIKLINSSDGVVSKLKEYINTDSKNGSIKIYTTGALNEFNILCNKIMNMNAEFIEL